MKTQRRHGVAQGLLLESEKKSDRDFKFIYRIGAGDFGQTTFAEHRPTGAQGCLKRNLSQTNEGEIIKQLNSFADLPTTMLKLLDNWNEYPETFIFMEFVPLAMPPGLYFKAELQAREALRSLCVSLSYLEDKKIIHGDVKPDNLRRRSNSEIVLCDYGNARIVRARSLWAFDSVFDLGSGAYLAPEGAALRSSHFSAHDAFSTARTIQRLVAPTEEKYWKSFPLVCEKLEHVILKMSSEAFTERMTGKEALCTLNEHCVL